MIRSLVAILCGLNSAAPSFPHKAEAAPLIRELARENAHDPYTLIELVDAESDWNPRAVNPKSGTVGLGQHKPRSEADAEALLEWRYNLRRTSGAFATWREFCRDKVGSALAIYWLQGYGGFDYVNGTTCGHRYARGRWHAEKKVPAYVTKLLAGRRELGRRCGS